MLKWKIIDAKTQFKFIFNLLKVFRVKLKTYQQNNCAQPIVKLSYIFSSLKYNQIFNIDKINPISVLIGAFAAK